MAGAIEITIRNISAFEEVESLLKRVPIAAQRAINRTASHARTESSRRLRQQINFSARYLVSKDGKIGLVPASKGRLQAHLSAQSRPSSLARFVVGAVGKKTGARVSVDPGGTRTLPGAFLLGIGENTLLAVRSPQKPRTAYKPRRIGKSLWSLYGPSVAQALVTRDGRGIWPELEPELAVMLENEFLRQMNLKV